MKTTVYLAPPGSEDDLAREIVALGRVLLSRHGRIFQVESTDAPAAESSGGSGRPSQREPAWAQDVWYDCETVEITSIADGARKLKARGRRWTLVSQDFHRRASLIQAELPKLHAPELEFLKFPNLPPFGTWTLLEPGRMLVAARSRSPCPGGDVVFRADRRAPSRAYLKLWELFTLYGIKPETGDRCLDLGASPGGWTWVLTQLGCQVNAIDRSPLDPSLMRLPNVSFKSGNALALKPDDFGRVDWLFSDVICYPQDLFILVDRWLKSPCRGFVCTLKFKGATDHAVADRFAAIAGSRLQHLAANKHELTWWLTR